MDLAEMKQKVYSLIEEYNEDADDLTNDPDLAAKMNTVINQIQNELARIKKLSGYTELEVEEGQQKKVSDIAEDIYQLNLIKDIDYEIIGEFILFKETGTAKIYYYRYPTQIDQDTEDDYEFELSTDVLEIMPYGVAGDILKSDVSETYGNIYYNRYRELIKTLDPRSNTGSIYIEGGVDL